MANAMASFLLPLLILVLLSSQLVDGRSRLAQQFPEKRFSRPNVSPCTSLLLDRDSAALYVGCRGFIGRLWAYNVNDTNENVVRQFFLRTEAESLIVCSSVAQKPELRVLHATKLTDREDPRTVIGICSTDARYNSTAVHVEWGNPGEAASFYAGIQTGMSGENHLIYRPAIQPVVGGVNQAAASGTDNAGAASISAMRTIYTDSTWLNDPQFVGSFDVGEYVYFFFREVAVEIGFAPPAVFSRIARVCKKDVGGRSVLRQVWTSFVKARLNCSLSGSSRFPFYFDHIQAVTRVDTDGDTLFYASLSSTPDEQTFPASALCVFSLAAVEQLFRHGVFIEQQQSGVWLPTPADSVPAAHRPGSCTANSTLLSDSDLHFAKTHLLMADPVSGGAPFLATRDAFFHSVLVDVLPEQHVVFALDHRDGRLWKVAHWREGGSYRWRLLQRVVLQAGGAIHSTALMPHEFLYTSSSSRTGGVSQFSLAACALHSSCAACAVDPFCAWSLVTGACARREKAKGTGWISSWAGRGASECASSAPLEQLTAYLGDAVHLRGSAEETQLSDSATTDNEDGVSSWRKNGVALRREGEEIVATADGGIILLNIRAEDAGEYTNGVGGRRYKLVVDTECERPTTLAGYHSAHREYCKQMSTMRQQSEEYEATCLNDRQSAVDINVVS